MSREDTRRAVELLNEELKDKINRISESSLSARYNRERIDMISRKAINVLDSVIDKLQIAKNDLSDDNELMNAINTAKRKSEKLYEEAMNKIRELNSSTEGIFFMAEEEPAQREAMMSDAYGRTDEDESREEEDPIREKALDVLSVWLKDLEK